MGRFRSGSIRIRANPELIRRFGHDVLVQLVGHAEPTLKRLPITPHGTDGRIRTVNLQLPDGTPVEVGLFTIAADTFSMKPKSRFTFSWCRCRSA